MISQALIEAYHATRYRVALPDGDIWFRPHEKTPELNEFTLRCQAKSWVFMTAYNPYSQLLPSAENEKRQRLLRDVLAMLGYDFYPAEGVGDTSQWPPEPSLFIVGLPAQKAIALGRVFEQHAVILCNVDGLPEIVFCER